MFYNMMKSSVDTAHNGVILIKCKSKNKPLLFSLNIDLNFIYCEYIFVVFNFNDFTFGFSIGEKKKDPILKFIHGMQNNCSIVVCSKQQKSVLFCLSFFFLFLIKIMFSSKVVHIVRLPYSRESREKN